MSAVGIVRNHPQNGNKHGGEGQWNAGQWEQHSPFGCPYPLAKLHFILAQVCDSFRLVHKLVVHAANSRCNRCYEECKEQGEERRIRERFLESTCSQMWPAVDKILSFRRSPVSWEEKVCGNGDCATNPTSKVKRHRLLSDVFCLQTVRLSMLTMRTDLVVSNHAISHTQVIAMVNAGKLQVYMWAIAPHSVLLAELGMLWISVLSLLHHALFVPQVSAPKDSTPPTIFK